MSRGWNLVLKKSLGKSSLGLWISKLLLLFCVYMPLVTVVINLITCAIIRVSCPSPLHPLAGRVLTKILHHCLPSPPALSPWHRVGTQYLERHRKSLSSSEKRWHQRQVISFSRPSFLIFIKFFIQYCRQVCLGHFSQKSSIKGAMSSALWGYLTPQKGQKQNTQSQRKGKEHTYDGCWSAL